MKDSLNWFEIPVLDFNRAKTFYESIYGIEMKVMEMEGSPMKWGFLPCDGGVGGSIAIGMDQKPSDEGTLIYLNGGNDLSQVLNKVEAAGGSIVLPKTSTGNGFMALFKDTEGNKLGLHSYN